MRFRVSEFLQPTRTRFPTCRRKVWFIEHPPSKFLRNFQARFICIYFCQSISISPHLDCQAASFPMSSFKRKTTVKPSFTAPGTRISPSSPNTTITSTGIPSLDDILGGGLPLSCSLLVTAPDLHSSYGELISKYFVAQGLACGHKICLVGVEDAWVEGCMWTPSSTSVTSVPPTDEKSVDEEKIKIAWRYEGMKQFRTTVTSPSSAFSLYVSLFTSQ